MVSLGDRRTVGEPARERVREGERRIERRLETRWIARIRGRVRRDHVAIEVVGDGRARVRVRRHVRLHVPDQRLHGRVGHAVAPERAIVRSGPAGQDRDVLRADAVCVAVRIERRGGNRRALVAERVAQLDEVAQRRRFAFVGVRQPALILVVLEGQRAVRAAPRVLEHEAQAVDRAGRGEEVVRAVERAGRRARAQLQRLRRLQRREVDAAREAARRRREAHRRPCEQVGADRAQVARGAGTGERDAIHGERGLRLVLIVQ